MPISRLLQLAAASLLVVGCATATLSPLNPLRFQRQNVALATPEKEVSRETLETLAGMLTGARPLPDGQVIAERGTTAGRNLTRQFIVKTLEEMGYQPQLHNYRASDSNILVHLPASTPSDETILVGAHLDSVRNPGADDNNSGTVAVLEAARVLQQLKDRKVNLIFAWFDEEELGLVGSRALAREYKKQGKKLASVHTLDMVGWDSDQDNAIEIEQPDGELWDYYQMVNKSHELNLPLIRTSSGDTDHVAFRNEGFKSVGLCEEWVSKDTTPHYHRRSDQFGTLNFNYLTNVTRLMVATISDLSRGVAAPMIQTRVDHSRFPARPRLSHTSYDEVPLD